MWEVFRNPQAETENQEDNVVLEEVAPKTAMEVEDKTLTLPEVKF